MALIVEVTGFRISGGQGDASCAPNCGRAFRPTGEFWNIHHIRCFDNDNQCLGSGGAEVLFDTVECDGNGFGSAFLQPTGRSSACIKQASTGGGDITVTGSNIHDNAWIGVWCDFGEDGPFIVENSTIVRNGKAGSVTRPRVD